MFKKSHTNVNAELTSLRETSPKQNPSTINDHLLKSEIYLSINKLKPRKSPGSDKIPAEVKMYEGSILEEEICRLCQIAWIEKNLPEEWAKLIVVTSGCAATTKQYRL